MLTATESRAEPDVDAVDPGLCQRVEEASLNAWPAMHQIFLDGWLLRFSGGFTRRANSIIPLYPSNQAPLDKIRYCENLYAREKLQTIFRLTSIADRQDLDAELEARGYAIFDPTLVVIKNLDEAALDHPGFSLLGLEPWLEAYCALARMPETASALHALLLKAIRTDALFGVLHEDGRAVACGMAVVENELVGLYDIITDPAHRRRGFGTRLVRALVDAGRAHGARQAYLQVMEENAPARLLYADLNFRTLYRYWYRIQPSGQRA